MSVSSHEDPPEPRPDQRCWSCGGCGADGGPHGARGALLAEAAGAALLVLLTCLPACAAPPAPAPAAAPPAPAPAAAPPAPAPAAAPPAPAPAPPAPAARPLAAGLAVALLVQCFDHISGAMMNPAVLLAAWLARRVRARAAAVLLAAQLAGAAAGGALLTALAPAPAPAAACLTLPRHDLSLYQAVGIEALLGGLLALANQAAWDARNRRLRDSWPLRAGLGVAGLSIIAGDLTGASMNPARSFAPALWSGRWEHHWVYWVGPLSGALACSLLYRAAWAPAPPRPRPPARGDDPAPAHPALPAGEDRSKTHYSV